MATHNFPDRLSVSPMQTVSLIHSIPNRGIIKLEYFVFTLSQNKLNAYERGLPFFILGHSVSAIYGTSPESDTINPKLTKSINFVSPELSLERKLSELRTHKSTQKIREGRVNHFCSAYL
jgi:hypothetical protein